VAKLLAGRQMRVQKYKGKEVRLWKDRLSQVTMDMYVCFFQLVKPDALSFKKNRGKIYFLVSVPEKAKSPLNHRFVFISWSWEYYK
jgi:hypothetical protein